VESILTADTAELGYVSESFKTAMAAADVFGDHHAQRNAARRHVTDRCASFGSVDRVESRNLTASPPNFSLMFSRPTWENRDSSNNS